MNRFLLLLSVLVLYAEGALAACPSPFVAKDGQATPTQQNLASINETTSNNCIFPTAIRDGTNPSNTVAVKGASTAPVAADPAAVVSISPNGNTVAVGPLPAGPNIVGKFGIDQTTPGTTNGVYIVGIGNQNVAGDPCQIQTPTYTPINIASATTTSIVTGAAAKKTYICNYQIVSATANNVALVEGTGASGACTTVSAGLTGGTTAATGYNFAANSGISEGNGVAAINATVTNADNLCISTSGAGQVSGHIKWVQQ